MHRLSKLLQLFLLRVHNVFAAVFQLEFLKGIQWLTRICPFRMVTYFFGHWRYTVNQLNFACDLIPQMSWFWLIHKIKMHRSFMSVKILRYQNAKLKWAKKRKIGNPRNFTAAKLSWFTGKSNNAFPKGICPHFRLQYWSPYWTCTQHPTKLKGHTSNPWNKCTKRGLMTTDGRIPIEKHYCSFQVLFFSNFSETFNKLAIHGNVECCSKWKPQRNKKLLSGQFK